MLLPSRFDLRLARCILSIYALMFYVPQITKMPEQAQHTHGGVGVCVPVCVMGLRVKCILCKSAEQKATVDEAGKACHVEGGRTRGSAERMLHILSVCATKCYASHLLLKKRVCILGLSLSRLPGCLYLTLSAYLSACLLPSLSISHSSSGSSLLLSALVPSCLISFIKLHT